MFHDASHFSFASKLEAYRAEIHREFLAIKHRLVDWVEKDLYDEGWQVFGLFNFPHGEPIAGQTESCPITSELIRSLVPTHGAAGFSLLKPHCHIRPHRGYQGKFLRYHLPLIVPEGDCALRVLGDTRRWRLGIPVIFDDRVEHEAWNRTSEPRVVLLLDFVPDGTHLPEASVSADAMPRGV